MYSKQNHIFALFFLSPLTEHTNASLTLSFSLPLEFFLSYPSASVGATTKLQQTQPPIPAPPPNTAT